MNQLSNELRQLGLGLTDHLAMKRYFDTAKCYPKLLITQNSPLMQHAYLMVPANVWSERILDLQDALQLSRSNEQSRRRMVLARGSGMTAHVDEVLDRAFLQKYDELLLRVKNDLNDYFPYRVSRTNQKLMVFERLDQFELINYVLRRL